MEIAVIWEASVSRDSRNTKVISETNLAGTSVDLREAIWPLILAFHDSVDDTWVIRPEIDKACFDASLVLNVRIDDQLRIKGQNKVYTYLP
jgi:hypothetical protein